MPLSMCGSYSSLSSIVHLCLFRSSYVAKRCQICSRRSPYGIGCLIAATLNPLLFRILATIREVWLFPDPVLTAHTETIGTFDFTIVVLGPISRKSAPLAIASEALCMTV